LLALSAAGSVRQEFKDNSFSAAFHFMRLAARHCSRAVNLHEGQKLLQNQLTVVNKTLFRINTGWSSILPTLSRGGLKWATPGRVKTGHYFN